MQPDVFRPDDDYCAYCHALAAGPCAECGAICCGDCVEVVLRFTSRRAVCKPCLAAGDQRPTRSGKRWLAVGLAILAAATVLVYGIAG